MKEVYLIVIVIVIAIIVFNIVNKKMENLENSDDKPYTYNNDGSKNFMDPKDAAEACRHISSRAEEIEAEWLGIAKVAEEISRNNPLGFLNPKNYASGDNKSKTITRNVITNDLSDLTSTDINNICVQVAAADQQNIINVNMSDCPYCLEVVKIKADLIKSGFDSSVIEGCSVSGTRQTNVAKLNQECEFQAAIELLRRKENSIDAQALADVIQKAKHILSGSNKSESMNCNVVKTDMSSKDYFKSRFDCSQKNTVKQENRIEGCAAFMDIIQDNYFESYDKCMAGVAMKKEEVTKSDTKATVKSKIDQLTEGFDIYASLSSFIASAVVSIISISVFGAVAVFGVKNADKVAAAAKTMKS
jgi:hypothetical protein